MGKVCKRYVISRFDPPKTFHVILVILYSLFPCLPTAWPMPIIQDDLGSHFEVEDGIVFPTTPYNQLDILWELNFCYFKSWDLWIYLLQKPEVILIKSAEVYFFFPCTCSYGSLTEISLFLSLSLSSQILHWHSIQGEILFDILYHFLNFIYNSPEICGHHICLCHHDMRKSFWATARAGT